MDSMNASLRLMRSSADLDWDLGATGMFDGILIDERGAVCGEKPARGRMGCRNVLYGSAGVPGSYASRLPRAHQLPRSVRFSLAAWGIV